MLAGIGLFGGLPRKDISDHHSHLPKSLILVENYSVPADTRVWCECNSLRRAGWDVTVISPKGKDGDTSAFESIDRVQIHRFDPVESSGSRLGYFREYRAALSVIRRLIRALTTKESFDVVHASNPPDFLLLSALELRRSGTAVIFDQHDLSPELYAAKYREAPISQMMLRIGERIGFSLADVAIVANDSFRELAISRGHKASEDVFVVRNGPDIDVFKPMSPDPRLKQSAQYLIGYVGVMGTQDGVDLAWKRSLA